MRGISLALMRHLLHIIDLLVFVTYRCSEKGEVQEHILKPLKESGDVDILRLNAAKELEEKLGSWRKEIGDSDKTKPSIKKAVLMKGILHPEKSSADLKLSQIMETFQTDVMPHLLFIKYFLKFLPTKHPRHTDYLKFLPTKHPQTVSNGELAKWVYTLAQVGSISDNARAEWYSYHTSKVALSQMQKTAATCVGVHPGMLHTKLSKACWNSGNVSRLFEPGDVANNIMQCIVLFKWPF
ncbi:hypothetical protein J3R30DRAFT_3657444 [Lentinula aciculospora]|uniref:Uncharacterized protein n=1 Tax=Lentinula aciculospora TaxID=153920 RepID=A0A9W9DNL4_9AGAR|nr:hypothetical protein J3R30DRAFT_3657444 [Lentinula aciculospora]